MIPQHNRKVEILSLKRYIRQILTIWDHFSPSSRPEVVQQWTAIPERAKLFSIHF